MSARQIACFHCRKELGEIRQATVRKGTCYICESCVNRFRNTVSGKSDLPNFADLFKGFSK